MGSWPGRSATIVGAVLIASQAGADAPQGMPHRSWQLQDFDREHVLATIPKAAGAGMNRIQLSHAIVMEAERLWEGDRHAERLALIRDAVRLAHEHRLKVDMWTHELSGVPEDRFRDPQSGRPRLDADLWAWVGRKYEKVFELVPDLDGIVLTFAETAHALHEESVVSDKTPSERVAEMIRVIHRVCVRHDKLLMIRTFVHHPDELEKVHAAVRAVAGEIGGRGHIVVMSKCVPHDWHPFYPFNPVLGDVEGLPQVMEIDLGQEYTGHSFVLHCEVDYVKTCIDYARSKGLIGAVARIERYDHHALGTPNEVNLYAFGRVLDDPDVTPERIWSEWAGQRYGEAAAPHVIRALRRTYDITNLMYFPLEHWVTWHSRFTDWKGTTSELMHAANRKWIKSPKAYMDFDELVTPNPDTLVRIDHEKQLARKLAELSLADLATARPHLADGDYNELKHYLELSRDGVEVFRLHHLAYFGKRMLDAGIASGRLSAGEREDLARNISGFVDELEEWAETIQTRYGKDVFVPRPDHIRSFVHEMREQLNEVRGER